jgi:hypothetical protein
MHKIISELLWTAPELLRSGDLRGTKQGDVFSYAMVCSELINNETAWGGITDAKEIDGLSLSICDIYNSQLFDLKIKNLFDF